MTPPPSHSPWMHTVYRICAYSMCGAADMRYTIDSTVCARECDVLAVLVRPCTTLLS